MHGLPQHRINPTANLKIVNPSLVAHAQVFAENTCPRTENPQGAYFELRAQSWMTGFCVTLAEKHGEVRLPDLYRVINLIPGGGEEWLNFAYDMHSSRFDVARNVEEDIAAGRQDSDGGFQGIVGELLKSVSALADPELMASVSPPYDFDLAQLCRTDQYYQFYLMPPAESVQTWAPIIKAFFVGAMIEKSRRPQAPRQVWFLDEAGQLGSAPLITKLYTYGAGIGITPFSIFQSDDQKANLGPKAKTILSSSAAVQIYFAAREIVTATVVSNMLGLQTLSYDEDIKQDEAGVHRQDMMQALLGGSDPLMMGRRLAHYRMAETHRMKLRRPLRTPDEVLNAPEDQAFIFTDGVRYPIIAERRNYYDERMCAGRYHPNPFYPPADKVRVMTRFGRRWRRVVRAPVPERFAHYPQYADGFWSRIKR